MLLPVATPRRLEPRAGEAVPPRACMRPQHAAAAVGAQPLRRGCRPRRRGSARTARRSLVLSEHRPPRPALATAPRLRLLLSARLLKPRPLQHNELSKPRHPQTTPGLPLLAPQQLLTSLLQPPPQQQQSSPLCAPSWRPHGSPSGGWSEQTPGKLWQSVACSRSWRASRRHLKRCSALAVMASCAPSARPSAATKARCR